MHDHLKVSVPPQTPPPNAPPHCPDFHLATPEFLKNCMNKYVYIWLRSGVGFWLYPTEGGTKYIYGYVWTGKDWAKRRIPWKSMESFY